MMQGLRINANGTQSTVAPANGTRFSLAELQAIVGGYIEIVYALDGQAIVLNEDGKLNDLPVNAGACALYGPARSGHDLIVGDVLVCPSSAID